MKERSTGVNTAKFSAEESTTKSLTPTSSLTELAWILGFECMIAAASHKFFRQMRGSSRRNCCRSPEDRCGFDETAEMKGILKVWVRTRTMQFGATGAITKSLTPSCTVEIWHEAAAQLLMYKEQSSKLACT